MEDLLKRLVLITCSPSRVDLMTEIVVYLRRKMSDCTRTKNFIGDFSLSYGKIIITITIMIMIMILTHIHMFYCNSPPGLFSHKK